MSFIKKEKISADIYTFREYITYCVAELSESCKLVLRELHSKNRVSPQIMSAFLSTFDVCLSIVEAYSNKEIQEKCKSLRAWILEKENNKFRYFSRKEIVEQYTELMKLFRISGLLQMERIKEEVKK